MRGWIGLLFCLGLLVGAIALPTGLVATHRGRLARRLHRARPFTCRELTAAETLPRRVVISGRVGPGPAGSLRAPVSDRPCVWFRVDIVHYPSRSNEGVTRFVHRAAELITVADATGCVVVSARALDRFISTADISSEYAAEVPRHASPSKKEEAAVCRRLDAAGVWTKPRNTFRLLINEMRVERGQVVTVLATPRRTPQGWVLDAGRGDGSSARDLAQLRTDADAERAEFLKVARPTGIASAVLLGVSGTLYGLLMLFG